MIKGQIKTLIWIAILAMGLRFAGITFDSLWLDEGYQSLFESMGQHLPAFMNLKGQPFLFHFAEPQPLSSVFEVFRDVDPLCPPIYPILLNRWMSLAGTSDLAIRSMSCLISTLSVVSVFVAARLFFGARAAVFAALIAAISPFEIFYGQEARMYALVSLLSVISTTSFVYLLRLKPGSPGFMPLMILYPIASWALINTHYTAVFLIAAHFILACFFCLKERDGKRFGLLMIGWTAVELLWLPWFGLFYQATLLPHDSFYVGRSFSWSWPLLALFVKIPRNWVIFLSGIRMVPMVTICATSIIMLVVATRFSATKTAGAHAESGENRLLGPQLVNICLIGWALLPALLVWLLDVVGSHRVVEIYRYVIATAPAIYILCGAGIAGGIKNQRLVAALLVAHAFFALTNNAYAHMVYQRQPWKEMAAKVNELVKPDEIILVSQHYNIVLVDRYLDRPMRVIGISPLMGKEKIEGVFRQFDPSAKRDFFWLLTAQEGEAVRDYLPAGYECRLIVDLPHSLKLWRYMKK